MGKDFWEATRGGRRTRGSGVSRGRPGRGGGREGWEDRWGRVERKRTGRPASHEPQPGLPEGVYLPRLPGGEETTYGQVQGKPGKLSLEFYYELYYNRSIAISTLMIIFLIEPV